MAAQALAVLRNDHPPDSALWRASNAAAVELNGVRPEGGRTADLLFVSWLLPWRGQLAIWALRHLGHREAVLRSYGEGPDGPAWSGPRVAGASPTGSGRTLGPRDALLPEIARAGLLVHPSFHDDAPLCFAEALSLGTPVVCLDNGGPAGWCGAAQPAPYAWSLPPARRPPPGGSRRSSTASWRSLRPCGPARCRPTARSPTPCWTLTSGPPAAPTADGEQGIGAAQGYTRHLGRRFSEGLVRRPLQADAARCLVTRRAAKSAP